MFLTVMFFGVLYFGMGMVTLICCQRLAPSWYFTWGSPDYYGKEHHQWYRYSQDLGIDYACTVIGWPIAWFFVLTYRVMKTNLNSMNKKLKLRAELEKELAAAREEIEELLSK